MTSMSVILAVLTSNIYLYFMYISYNDNVHDVNVSHSGRSYINISISGIYLTTIMSMTSTSVILAALTSNIYFCFRYISYNDNVNDVNVSHSGRSYIKYIFIFYVYIIQR